MIPNGAYLISSIWIPSGPNALPNLALLITSSSSCSIRGLSSTGSVLPGEDSKGFDDGLLSRDW